MSFNHHAYYKGCYHKAICSLFYYYILNPQDVSILGRFSIGVRHNVLSERAESYDFNAKILLKYMAVRLMECV